MKTNLQDQFLTPMDFTPPHPASPHRLVLVIVTLLLAAGAARGGTTIYTGAFIDEPTNHNSVVRDAGIAGTRGPNIVANDATYAADLKANVTAGSVDILFQQCYGGGFLNDIMGTGPANFTAAAAARWNETALNHDQVLKLASPLLDNYTRAWRDAASTRSANGFLDWYQSAVTGTGIFTGVRKDPFASVPEAPNTEHPMYATADNPTGGVNDKRTLMNNPSGPKQYAILVAWDKPNPRHVANLARIYWLLQNQFNVPLDNIVTLLDNQKLGNSSVNYNFLDSAISGPVFFDGNNQRATWLKALKGVLFSTAGVVNGSNIPGPNDKLFIYNTGHGLHMLSGEWVVHGAGDAADTVSGIFNIATNGFATGFQLTDDEASTVMDTNGNVCLQLQLSQQINPDALITVQGVASASAASALVTDPSLVYNYNGVVNTAFTYQLELPEDLLSLVATNLQLSVSGLAAPYVNGNLVLITSFIGGDQELAYIPQPPAASSMTVPRTAGLTLKIALSDIATNWSDIRGYPVELTAINLVSTNGQTVYPLNLQTNPDGSYVITNTAFLGYVNSADVNDQISYTITDGLGGTSTGLINIVVSTSPLFGQITGIVNPGGKSVTLNFAGYPGYTYALQRSIDLVKWSTIANLTAPPAGPFTFTDTFGDLGGMPPPAAYYRLSWNPP